MSPLTTTRIKTDPTSASITIPQVNTVSWQSAFFGLVPLALNAMTQPSSFDAMLPESSILFAAHSSPFICIADSLEVLIELSIYMYQGRNLREAARLSNWRRARHRLGEDIMSLDESAAEKHPKPFFILFIATLLQTIKILGLEGLFWTKVWAGCYLCSYVGLAGVQFLAPENWRDDPPKPRDAGAAASTEDEIMTAVHRILVTQFAKGAHISCLCNALSRALGPRIPAPYGVYDITIQGSIALTSLFIVLDICTGVGTSFILLAILDFLFLFLIHVLLIHPSLHKMQSALQSPKQPSTGDSGSVTPLGSSDTGFLGVLPGFMAYLYHYNYPEIFPAGTGYVEIMIFLDGFGRFSLIICSGIFLLFFLLLFTVFKKVYFVPGLRPQPEIPLYVIVFPFLNFFVALLYYRFAYDPRGTVKPAWTDNLG